MGSCADVKREPQLENFELEHLCQKAAPRIRAAVLANVWWLQRRAGSRPEPGDGQAKAKSAPVFMMLFERIEERCCCLGAETPALILDFNDDVLSVHLAAHVNLASVASELDRVLDEVGERRVKSLLVRFDHQRWIDLDFYFLIFCSSFDSRGGEDLIDDQQQMTGLRMNFRIHAKPHLRQRFIDEFSYQFQASLQHFSRASA